MQRTVYGEVADARESDARTSKSRRKPLFHTIVSKHRSKIRGLLRASIEKRAAKKLAARQKSYV
jgi:hypothetical protein